MSDSPRQLIAWTIAMTALAVTIVAALYFALDALILMYVSGLVAIGFGPVVRAIERQRLVPVGGKRMPRWLAILAVYVAIVGAVVAVAAMIVPPLIEQAQQLWRDLPSWIDRAQNALIERGLISRRITFEEAVQGAPGDSTSAASSAVGTVATALGTLAGGIVGFVTVLILAFYLLLEGATLFAAFSRLFPHERRAEVLHAGREISAKVSAWMTGQLILGGTIGATSAIALYLLGVPYFYVLALVSALGELIPVVGPILAAVPAIAVAFTVSPRTALWVALFFVGQQQVENHLLVPKIMERKVGVSAVVVIVALLIGSSLFGVLGAILAIPTAAILQVVLQSVFSERDA